MEKLVSLCSVWSLFSLSDSLMLDSVSWCVRLACFGSFSGVWELKSSVFLDFFSEFCAGFDPKTLILPYLEPDSPSSGTPLSIPTSSSLISEEY